MTEEQLKQEIQRLNIKLQELEQVNEDLVKEIHTTRKATADKILLQYEILKSKFKAAEDFINFVITQEVTDKVLVVGGEGYYLKNALKVTNENLKKQIKARKQEFKKYQKRIEKLTRK